MTKPLNLNIVLLHENMADKQGKIVTTSLTLIDVHDVARCARTYGLNHAYIAHPSEPLRRLASTLKLHWEEGFGATYNPNRKDALGIVEIVENLEQVRNSLNNYYGMPAKLIATSAKGGEGRISFSNMREIIEQDETPYLVMLGTGWGMSQSLLSQADYMLEPICGPSPYNHLSVRGACAVILDRLMSR